MRSSSQLTRLIVVGALLAATGVSAARADEPADPYRSPARCGALDTPETGIQGDVPRADQESGRAEQGYNCGLAVVGHNGFDGASSSSLAWSGDCAYVQGGGGVRVLDVSDPTNPVTVAELPGAGGGSENIQAVTTDDRAVLIATRSVATSAANLVTQGLSLVDVYDVSTCTEPQLKGTISFPNGAHNIGLTPDATKVFVTMSLQMADIANLENPSSWTVRNLQCEIVAQHHPAYGGPSPLCDLNQGGQQQLSHEVEFNKSGTRLYIGGQLPTPYEEYVHVVDLTTSPVRVISSTPGAAHGIRRATIDGDAFLLRSDETAPGVPQPAERRSNGCLPEQATPFASTAESYLTDISDETAPHTVSKLGLAINRPEPETCAAALDSSVNSTVHYNTVDDPENTTFAMLSMKNAGLRVFDVRDPAQPVEAAYFNPGQYRATDGSTSLDRVRMHTRYRPETGHIWMLSEQGGFRVLELEPQVRTALGLPEMDVINDDGAPARSDGATALVESFEPKPTAATSYCRLWV